MTPCPACSNPGVEHFCMARDRVLPRPDEQWQIVRCKECGFGWTNPPPPLDRMASYYPRGYIGNVGKTLEEFLSGKLVRSRSWKSETSKVGLVEKYIRGGTILDVGCGDGKFLWALDSRKWKRVGVDFGGETLRLVQERMPSLRLISGDLFSTALAEGAFDVITFWHALEHIPDPSTTLVRASNLLRPGGWLFVSLPNLDSLQADLFKSCWYPFDDVPRHLYHFTKRSLGLFLSRVQMDVRANLFFSRQVNFHSLKHSLLCWSRERLGSRIPYYLLKPFLFAFPVLEQISGRFGILTTVARKPLKATGVADLPRKSLPDLNSGETKPRLAKSAEPWLPSSEGQLQLVP
jgi:ubiquinone/menaquinone biosynthesis C-methylase UbiE